MLSVFMSDKVITRRRVELQILLCNQLKLIQRQQELKVLDKSRIHAMG